MTPCGLDRLQTVGGFYDAVIPRLKHSPEHETTVLKVIHH